MSRDMEGMTDYSLIPNPLRIALDVAERLRHELSRHMTPDKRRDIARLEKLINKARDLVIPHS